MVFILNYCCSNLDISQNFDDKSSKYSEVNYTTSHKFSKQSIKNKFLWYFAESVAMKLLHLHSNQIPNLLH